MGPRICQHLLCLLQQYMTANMLPAAAWPLSAPAFPHRSCLQLLVCVLNLLLASSTFTEQQLAELQQQSPAAIGASGRFCTLKTLSLEAKVDFANTQVWLWLQLLLFWVDFRNTQVWLSLQLLSLGALAAVLVTNNTPETATRPNLRRPAWLFQQN
jgi:hypothetical protein